MSTANPTASPLWTGWFSALEKAGPKPAPYRPPVLIHDAVLPWRGETLLLTMLRETDTGE